MPPIRRRTFAAGLGTAALGTTALLAGCTTPPPRGFPQIGFEDRPPIALDVADVQVVQQYQPSSAPPNVETRMPDRPGEIVARWAATRLASAGTAGTAQVIVEEASVVEEALARTGGVRGVFTLDQSERYTLTLAVRIEAENPARGLSGFVRSVAQRSITVAENASLARREEEWFRLLEETARDLDRQLEQNLRANLSALVVR